MKKFKKFSAFMLAVVMTIAMLLPGMTVSASGNYKLTIKTVANHTYKIYQLATGDVSKDGGKLSNIKVGANVKEGTKVSDITSLGGKQDSALGDAAWALVNDKSTPIETVVGDDMSKTVGLPGGYYLVVDTYTDAEHVADGDSISRYMVDMVKDTEMTPKTITVEPDKKIVEGEELIEQSEASIGDVITYQLSGTLPNMEGYETFKYVFADTLSAGLTLDAEHVVGQRIVGKVGDVDANFDVTSVIKNNDGTTSIRIALLNPLYYKDLYQEEPATLVTVNIQATLNRNAFTVNANENKVKVDFSNDPNFNYNGDPDFGENEPKGQTPEVLVKTYTTALTITKTDADGAILTGAEFELKGTGVNVGYVTGQEYVEASDGTWYKLASGAYTQEAPDGSNDDYYADVNKKYNLIAVNKETEGEVAQVEAKAFVDENGKVVFTGLGAGKYTLTETTTPNGYNTIDPISFEVTWNNDKGFEVIDLPEGIDISVEKGKDDQLTANLSTTIKNNQGTELPSTGGIGTTIFYIVGAILVIGAGIILVAKKRMSQEQ